MSFFLIDDQEGVRALEAQLSACARFALDLEAAGFHRYSDRICLAQVTVGGRNYVLDPLVAGVAELLREPLRDPGTEVIMHGASHDLRLLRRDWRISVRGLVDTCVAAELLGLEATGLGALVEERLGVALPKSHQRADWAIRPLPATMLDYAANDTRYLPSLADGLLEELRESGREPWFGEECRNLEASAERIEARGAGEPAARVKGSRHLQPRELQALRAALDWRDSIARSRDMAPFRVVGDRALLEVATRNPRSVVDLGRIRGIPRALVRDEGRRLVRELASSAALPESRIPPLEKSSRRNTGRVPRELEPALRRAREVRNSRASELGLKPGRLLPNATIATVVRSAPGSLEELAQVSGVRKWQVELLGPELLEAVSFRERANRTG